MVKKRVRLEFITIQGKCFLSVDAALAMSEMLPCPVFKSNLKRAFRNYQNAIDGIGLEEGFQVVRLHQ